MVLKTALKKAGKELKMSIATLPPLLEGEWISVREAISSQLRRMSETEYNLKFDVYENPESSKIYAQASLGDSGNFIIEIESNQFLDTKFSDREIQVLRILGWQMPSAENPNYWRKCPQHWDKDLIATLLLQALLRTNRLNQNSWFSFGFDEFGLDLAQSGAFWVNKDDSRFLCLMGSNSPNAVPQR